MLQILQATTEIWQQYFNYNLFFIKLPTKFLKIKKIEHDYVNLSLCLQLKFIFSKISNKIL